MRKTHLFTRIFSPCGGLRGLFPLWGLGGFLLLWGFTASAQDTISFTWKGGVNKQFYFFMTGSATVNWGDGFTDTNKGTLNHTYADTNYYTVSINGYSENNVIASLLCSGSQLTSLCIKGTGGPYSVECSSNQLSSLDVSNAKLYYIYCYGNQLPLSDLYVASMRVNNTNNKRLGLQFLPIRQIVVEDTIDFSSQAIFGSINTDFVVYNDYMSGIQATINVDYTINNGIIVFKKAGNYWISMSNTAIRSHASYPAIVTAEFHVRDFNNDATLANLSISAGTLTPVFHSDTLEYTVEIEYEIKEINITAIQNDTNAIISGDTGLQQLNVGKNIFTIIVTAEDKVTKRDYIVAVERADTIIDNIIAITQEISGIKIYPNPASTHLIIEIAEQVRNDVWDIEIFDVVGRNVGTNLRVCPENNEIIIDISRLTKGVYFLKILIDKNHKIKKIIVN